MTLLVLPYKLKVIRKEPMPVALALVTMLPKQRKALGLTARAAMPSRTAKPTSDDNNKAEYHDLLRQTKRDQRTCRSYRIG